MKKIMITGAGSYIGECVKDYLLSEPDKYSVDIIDTMGFEPKPDDFAGYDVVFNVAGIAHIKETDENRALYFKVNRDLVIKIAKAAKAGGVKQFVLLSSMSVYGKLTGRISKKTKAAPTNAYGKSKAQADAAIAKLADDSFRFACLRPPMVYGKGCKGNYQTLRKFALASPVFPDYRNKRSMVYIGNLCEFVKQVIDEEKSGLFFPQNAEYVNTSEMVRRIARLNGEKIRLTGLFNAGIKLAKFNVVKKVFGDLIYEKVDTVDKFGFEDSISLTETGECLKKTVKSDEKMRILATCQYGWPEPYPSLYPMEEMAKRGHYVHAITGTPNYPMGDVFEGYRNKTSKEQHNGIDITHVPVIPRKKDTVHRMLNYHSYPVSAKFFLSRLKGKYDVIFANQSSPVMMVEPAIAYAKKHDKRVVMYCMDLWPASLCVGGVSKDSAVYKFYYKISKKIYQQVDVLLVTSRKFKDYFMEEFGIPGNKIVYLPQYALSTFNHIPQGGEKDTTDLVFAGNVGTAQNIGVILRAAAIIQREQITDNGKRIVFHIVGEGQELDNLKSYAKKEELENVIFHGRKPSEEMPKYYGLADAMIVTLLPDPLISLTLPAKVQSYMAAGKPIIASADGEIPDVISESRCGFCAKADDEQDLVRAVKEFIASPERQELGENGRKYYSQHFAVDIVMDKLEDILRENCR
ncbi:MAG: glycosyltransferase [Ruminococcus sp.]|uniref:glycosyltransferase n=1 Tax=Ruminococcus sp. TaxID=41978 RepID=UPI0025F67CE2|nr:glycosyltransferase [Ruminococcus sp.]MBR5682088.1 glycosyltransferase [Ruminococcus sp.]